MGHILSTGGVDLVMALQQDGAARVQARSTSHVNLYVNWLETLHPGMPMDCGK